MTYKFTNRAKKAIEIANEVAIELGHNYKWSSFKSFRKPRSNTRKYHR